MFAARQLETSIVTDRSERAMEEVRRGLPGCLELYQVLGRMMLTVPQDVRRAGKAARPKKSGMRYEHAAAIVTEGLKHSS
jgi:hypothetical protein